MLGQGTGSEVMQRIAAPMIGGMVTAPILSMFVIPAGWYLLQMRQVRHLQTLRHTHDATAAHQRHNSHLGEIE